MAFRPHSAPESEGRGFTRRAPHSACAAPHSDAPNRRESARRKRKAQQAITLQLDGCIVAIAQIKQGSDRNIFELKLQFISFVDHFRITHSAPRSHRFALFDR
ncbi:hypothetical protein [Rhodoblastus sp.]|uniref:hypothetical protein n=1 Tax=Rhodoblastus sp. TaxID=1962975 RepID=UPI0035B30902